jgi:hypothetical protein
MLLYLGDFKENYIIFQSQNFQKNSFLNKKFVVKENENILGYFFFKRESSK